MPLNSATDAISDLWKFFRIAHEGLETANIFTEIDETLERETTSNRKDVEEFARSQRARGFPYLIELAVVRLWSILEVCCNEIVVEQIMHDGEVRKNQTIRKLSGSLLDFLDLDERQQGELVAHKLKEKLGSPLHRGVGRFEAILDEVNRGGGVIKEVRDTLFELSEIRHVVVHRGGVVDARFSENCPHLNLTPGDSIQLHDSSFEKYVVAARWFVVELSRRAEAEQDDAERSVRHQEILGNLEGSLINLL